MPEFEKQKRIEADFSMKSERDLVDAARRDPAAFSKLYARYVDPVYRYLYKWTGNSAEAEDLTSQVFIEVLEKFVHYQERGNFAAWLFTIARNKAIGAHRRHHHILPLEDAESMVEPTGDPLERTMHAEQMARMAELISRLKEDQRELLRLRFTAGLSYGDIGSLLGRSESAIKMAVLRLLRQLHGEWKVR